MFGALAKKIFGSANDRRLKTYAPKVAAINALEAEVAALDDEGLRARTAQFKAQLEAAQGDAHTPLITQPNVALVYATDAYAPHAEALLDHLRQSLPTIAHWCGTVGVGVCGSNVEYFDEPALSVMLLDLPSDQYRVFSGVASTADVDNVALKCGND